MGCAISAITKLVTSTMLLMAFRPDRFQPLCKPRGRRLHGYVFENQRGVARAQVVVFDIDANRARAVERPRLHGIDQLLAGDRRHFARHAVVAPQIGPMRQRFVIDLDDGIAAVGFHALAFGGFEGDEAGELGGRCV